MNPNQNAPSLGSSLIWVHTVYKRVCLSIKETAVVNVRKRLKNLSLVLKVGRKINTEEQRSHQDACQVMTSTDCLVSFHSTLFNVYFMALQLQSFSDRVCDFQYKQYIISKEKSH